MRDVNKKYAEISIKGQANSFFYKLMHYLGILLVVLLIITALYIMDYITSIIKKDYPNLK